MYIIKKRRTHVKLRQRKSRYELTEKLNLQKPKKLGKWMQPNVTIEDELTTELKVSDSLFVPGVAAGGCN